MNSKSWQSSGQLDISDFGVDLGAFFQISMFGENLLFNFIDSDVRLGQELFQTAK